MTKADARSSLSGSKKKSSRSFRGLVTGKSKKDKKKAKSEETLAPLIKEPTSPSSVVEVEVEKKSTTTTPIDDETVYGADFDEASRAAPTVASETQTKETETEPVGDPIAIILLVMDPLTRRFEIIQLEFDSTQATAADILDQIPISATEKSLRCQTYDRVCDVSGLEYENDKPLSDYVEGNALIITVPKSNTQGAEHAAKMAKPILNDPSVQEMLKNVGVVLPNLPGPEEVIDTKDSSAAPKAPEASKAPKEVPCTPPPTPYSEPRSTKSVTKLTPAIKAPIQQPSESPKSSKFTTLLIMGAVMAYMARVLVNFQGQITSPLEPGTVLVPGAWRSRCGFVQTNGCKPAYIEMGIDGKLQVVENEGVTFSLSGNVCAEKDKDCVPGAAIQEDGTLKIGGVLAKIDIKSKVPLNPWPFSDGIGVLKGKKAWS